VFAATLMKGLPRRRCQHAFGVGLHAHRRAWQSRSAACSRRSVRYRDRLAWRDRLPHHGWVARCMDRPPTISAWAAYRSIARLMCGGLRGPMDRVQSVSSSKALVIRARTI